MEQNLQDILARHKLTLRPDTFHGIDKTRDHVKLVLDGKGTEYILKTGKIDEYQIDLLEIAKKIQDQINFTVPEIIHKGGYLLLEKVKGKPLQEYYDSKPEWCIDLFKRLNDDYQTLLGELLEEGATPDDKLKTGRTWLTSRMYAWAKPIIERKLLVPEDIEQLQRDINRTIEKKGEAFFGWSHANIHGSHVIVAENKKPSLLDPTIESRPGNGYYDFLRSLDHFFFTSKQDPEKLFSLVNDAIKKYLAKEDQDEVRLVFAFRAIGVLGQDILNNPKYKDDLDMEAKFPYLLKWIKREY